MKIALILMIKNEERILKRCLEAVENIVDCFCILDTGSTDKTVEIAEEFLKTHTGCVTVEPWKNFGHNRTVSFQNAQAYLRNELKWDLKDTYGLLLDADMVFVPGKLKQQNLSATGYRFIQINGSLEYYNTRLVRMDYPWKCVSVTHEYWDGPTETLPKEICYIDDRNDGGCKHDKFERDQKLLEQGLLDEPTNVRYMFYLAQTYKCLGKHKDAIKMYKKRIHAGGWPEEVWYSMYMIGECWKIQGNISKFEDWMQRAHHYRPQRSESIYKLAEFFRVVGHHYKAYHYTKLGQMTPFPKDDVLFIEGDVYRGKFDYEASILDYYVHQDKSIGLRDSIKYLLKRGDHINNVVSNLKFYTKSISQDIQPINIKSPFPPEFHPSAISVLKYPYANARLVNYKIKPDGSYTTSHGIVETENAYINLETGESWAIESPTPVFDSHIKGIEDLRIYEVGDKTYFTATSYKQYIRDTISIVAGEYDIENKKLLNVRGIQSPFGQYCEKNWVNIPGSNHEFIYSWSPFRIGTLKDTTIEITKTINTPPLFQLFRGSAPPMKVGDKWKVLVHFVEYCTPRKYYHCFVEFDSEWNILRVSLPFYFKNNAIEYCISTRIVQNGIECYVSSNDSNPSKMFISNSHLEWITISEPVQRVNTNANSTIISMFFDLKNLPDSTNDVRPIEFYLEHGKKTLELPYPMVLFCDEKTRPLLENIRGDLPTKYVEKNITEYDYFKELYPKIVENRNIIPSPDPRNTVSYFLTSMFKIHALNLVKESNYYPNTTHYFWIDLGGSHVMRGFPNSVHKALKNPNDKISCGYIHYRPDTELYPMKEFMKIGNKCCIGCGFFSIQSDYIEKFCESIFDILREQVELGVGHSEEQCMAYCYSKHPEWFSLYFADYYSLITNYHSTVDDINCVQRNFIEIAKRANRTDLVELALESIKK